MKNVQRLRLNVHNARGRVSATFFIRFDPFCTALLEVAQADGKPAKQGGWWLSASRVYDVLNATPFKAQFDNQLDRVLAVRHYFDTLPRKDRVHVQFLGKAE